MKKQDAINSKGNGQGQPTGFDPCYELPFTNLLGRLPFFFIQSKCLILTKQ